MNDPERPAHGDLHGRDLQEHDRDLQELAAYAAEALGAPVALLTELGADRQSFLANVGFGRAWTSLEESFCAHTVRHEGVFEVPDTAADPRFADNPLVTGEPHVRFYAGVALDADEGGPKNALCVLDTRPRALSDFQRRTLAMLARQVKARLELRSRTRELERSSAEAHRSAELVRMVTDRLPVRVAYIDRGFRFRFVNDAYLTQVGLSREAAVGRTLAETLGEAMFEQARPNLERAFAGETHTQEFEAPYNTGVRPVRATYVPDVAEDGSVLGAVVQVVDLTEQRATERELVVQRARLDDVLRLSPTFVTVLRGEELRFEYANPAYLRLVGNRPTVGLTLAEAQPEAVEGGALGQRFDALLREVMRTGVPRTFTRQPVRYQPTPEAPLEERILDFVYQPLQGVAGQEAAIFAQGLDVTEQALAERALVEAQARLDRTLRTADVATYDWDVANDRLFGNDLLARFFGAPSLPEGSPIAPYLQNVHPDDREPTRAAIAASLATGARYETQYRVRGSDGVERWVLARGDTSRDEAGRPLRLSGVVLDVTGRIEAERALRSSEETFRAVFEQAPDDAIIVMDENRAITAWNPAAERLTGWSAAEAVGRLADLIFTPEDRQEGAPAHETGGASRQPNARDERWHLRKDGSRFWGSGTMNALHDEAGNVNGFLKVFRDDTERRRMIQGIGALNDELEAKVAQRTQDLQKAVSESEGFNYAISHDLRTPLRAIAMTSGVLLEEAGPDLTAEHRAMLARQGRAARRLGQLIDELLQLSRLARVELKRRPIDMTQEAWTAAWSGAPGCGIEVQDGMVAEGDPGLVLSVWQNLIGNACKFSPNGGTIRVGHDGTAFFVRDEGVGFDLRFAPKIFLPFERLVADDEFPGTGIGLANVKRIVERHGGRVWAESAPGRGSTFWFTLAPERTA